MSLVRRMIFAWSYRRAVRTAERLRRERRRVFMVLCVNGRPRVVSRDRLVGLVRDGAFKKGVDIRTLERRALYVTK